MSQPRLPNDEDRLTEKPDWLHEWWPLLSVEERAGIRYREIDGRIFVAVVPFLYTAAIIVGNCHDRGGYEDRWCFHTREAAEAAFDGWNGVGEPLGWHRHPMSGRYRTDGDPAREHVQD